MKKAYVSYKKGKDLSAGDPSVYNVKLKKAFNNNRLRLSYATDSGWTEEYAGKTAIELRDNGNGIAVLMNKGPIYFNYLEVELLETVLKLRRELLEDWKSEVKLFKEIL